MISYWQQTAWFNQTDVAIIGGGIVGLSAAIHLKLKEPALRVSLFEKGLIPAGASTRNAGFATFGSVSELVEDLLEMPAQDVFQLTQRRFEGLRLLRKLVPDNVMEYESCGGYEVFSSQDELETCIQRIPEINEGLKEFTGLQATFAISSKKATDFGFAQVENTLLFNQYEGAIHSGKMIQVLMDKARNLGIQLFYGFEVDQFTSLENGVELQFKTPNIHVHCKKVLACTNGFSKQFFPALDVKPARGLILVTEPIPELTWKGTFHHNKGYDYFRHVGNRILLGGGRNIDVNGETTTAEEINPKIEAYLLHFLQEKILPNTKPTIEYKWTGTMGIGENKRPILQECLPHVFCAVRMGGMGVALGSQIGADASNMISESFQ